jgi:hypothetical protein
LIAHVIDRIGPQVCGSAINAEAEPDLDVVRSADPAGYDPARVHWAAS